MTAKETASASRTPERLLFPRKPEYISPFFSFEIRDPDELATALVRVYKLNEYAVAHLGEGAGVIDTPEIKLNRRRRHGVELGIQLNLPNDYFSGFINVDGNFGLGRSWRNWFFERKLRKYVDSGFSLEGRTIEKREGNMVVRRVANLPHHGEGRYVYFLPQEDFAKAGITSLNIHLTEALKILVIYCTELYRYYRLKDFPRRVVLTTPVSVKEWRVREMSPQERLADLESGGIERAVARAILGLSDDKESPEVRIEALSKLVEHYQAELNFFKAHLSRSEARIKTLEEEARERQTTPYDVLGIFGTAAKEEILRAYRQQASVWHPDFIGGLLDKAGLGSSDARRAKILQFTSERMVKINQALEELKRQGRV